MDRDIRSCSVRELLELVQAGVLRRVETPEARGMLKAPPRADRRFHDDFTSTVDGAAAYERMWGGHRGVY